VLSVYLRLSHSESDVINSHISLKTSESAPWR